MNNDRESYTVNMSPVRIVAHFYLTFLDGRLESPGEHYETEADAMIALAAKLSGSRGEHSLCVAKGYYRTFVAENLQLDAVTPVKPASVDSATVDNS